ncbi:MAG: energy transducer TonB [Candidatus Methylomirabilia bacterium]
MSRAAKSGVSVRALRDFGLALRSGPFRVAFVISLIVHLALLAVFGWGKLGREGGGERRIPLMRVRLLSPAPPAEVPAAPAVKPAAGQPRRPPAAVQPPLPASTLRAAEEPVSTVAPVAAPEVTVHDPVRQLQVSEETALPAAVAPPPLPSAGEAQISDAPATGVVSSPTVPAANMGGSEGFTVPGAERDGQGSAGVAAAPTGDDGAAAAAATASPAGTGPGDLAAIRHRIDAHKLYPQIAVRNGWEGRVLVEMRLEGDGRLSTVRLLEGSGYAVLDDATIVAVRRASPFPPVARVLTVPVEYRLVP